MGSAIAVGFDIDHTLCIDNKLERVAFLHVLERIVEEGGTPLGTLAQETAAIDALLAAQRAGAFSIADAVRDFVRKRGVTPTEAHVSAFEHAALRMVDDFVVRAPDAKATLGELRERGIPTAILSNGWNPLQIAKARRAGFRGTVIASADIGVQKPDPAAFAALIDALGVEPKCAYYVGDDPRLDVAGAEAAGLNGVWLNNEGASYPQGVRPARNVIGSLHELLAILPGAAV